MTPTELQQAVDQLITERHSVRAFLPDPVPAELLQDLFRVAARAPSGTNTQPWKVYVLTGEKKNQLSQKILQAHDHPDPAAPHTEEYHYYPLQWTSPYLERRRKVGWDLYALLGLGRDNKAGMHTQHGRNYTFFDAPVGLMFTIDRIMEQGSWLDYGMFLQNLMLAAKARGLDTCPQAAFTQYHRIISEHLSLPDSEMLVCGMSLGYADMSKPENSLQTAREPVSGFVRFME
jgi:nitroreductase